MTDFNFLRIKWPKLAAIAADAGRLVEVSPASAIQTMQNFCEWAADIALDFYEINAQNGTTQQEKIDTLRATGHVPADIVERFRSIMLAGGRRMYRDNEDVEEARQCIEDVYEIGRWLNKEADRAGWPPRSDYYRPVITPLGSQAEGGGGGGFSSGRISQAFGNFKPLILLGAGAIVVIGLAIWGVSSIVANSNGPKATLPNLTPTPTVKPTDTPILVTMPVDAVTATPAPETYVFLDTLTAKVTKETFYKNKWKTDPLTIGDKTYTNGFGMYIPRGKISGTDGTWSMEFHNLDGKYSKLKFDLGADANPKWYGSGYGYFRIRIYVDSTSNLVYDMGIPDVDEGGLKEYTFTDFGREVNIAGANKLIIRLTERKGSKGTINVVLGDARLVLAQDGSAEQSPDANATGTAGTSAEASPSATAEGEEGDTP